MRVLRRLLGHVGRLHPDGRRGPGHLRRFRRDERGVWSVHNLFLTITCCCLGAAAVDVTHLRGAKSQLQVTADIAAHAALYTRRYGSPSGGVRFPLTNDVAAQRAVSAATFGIPASYGPILTTTNVTIGRWDFATRTVVADASNPEAARVVTTRAGTDPVGTFLFRIIGLKSFNVRAAATFILGPARCTGDQGFFSEDEVQINSGNTFHPGFCIGAPEFQVQNGNMFRPGVGVTIPTAADLDISSNDVNRHNPGLMQALQYGTVDLSSELNRVRNSDPSLAGTSLDHFTNHNYANWLLQQPHWSTIVRDRTVWTPVNITSPSFTRSPSEIPPGRVYVVRCLGNNTDLSLREGSGSNNTFRNIVILTDCMVRLTGAARLENVVISTTSTHRKSIEAPSNATGFTVGANDNCAPGGGAALLTRGGFDVAAKLNFYGAIVRAAGVANFQSGAYGEGVSLMAAGVVDTNSGIEMKACGPAAGALPTGVALNLIQ